MTYEQIGKRYNRVKDTVHKRFKKLFRLISRHCTRGEIFREIFLKDEVGKYD
jgi:plasmid replication initiation protein